MFASSVVELLLLDSASDLIQSVVGEFDDVEVINNLGGFGQDDVEDGLVSRRHVQGAKVDTVLPFRGLTVQKSCYINVFSAWNNVDDLVVFDIADGSDVTGSVSFQASKASLVQADRAGAVQAFVVCGKQYFTVAAHSVIYRVPVASQFSGYLFDGSSSTDLFGCPFRSPGCHATLGGSDPGICTDPGRHFACHVGAFEPVFTPGQTHWFPVDRQVNVRHLGSVFDPCGSPAFRASLVAQELFHAKVDKLAFTSVMQDGHVFETNQGQQNRSRISNGEGVSIIFLDHT